ncbi:hypothetical protein Tcan_00958, partial [Toxocara canis]
YTRYLTDFQLPNTYASYRHVSRNFCRCRPQYATSTTVVHCAAHTTKQTERAQPHRCKSIDNDESCNCVLRTNQSNPSISPNHHPHLYRFCSISLLNHSAQCHRTQYILPNDHFAMLIISSR